MNYHIMEKYLMQQICNSSRCSGIWMNFIWSEIAQFVMKPSYRRNMSGSSFQRSNQYVISSRTYLFFLLLISLITVCPFRMQGSWTFSTFIWRNQAEGFDACFCIGYVLSSKIYSATENFISVVLCTYFQYIPYII